MEARRLRRRAARGLGRGLGLALWLLLFGAATVLALPHGQQVVSGQATFRTQGGSLTVTNSPGAILHWQGFSIGAAEAVRFAQQSAASSVLNRVIGQDPSRILGLLQSNGRVFLVNPNGILFGRGSRVDVNGLVASTLNISNHDFLAGRYNFAAGATAGAVSNEGTITTPGGGTVYLIAPDVENSGLISTPKGGVFLAAGRSVQLVDSQDPDISVTLSAPADRAVNLGRVLAQSGKAGIYGSLVAQRGTVNADSAVAGENGRILFKATRRVELDAGSETSASGPDGGRVTVQSGGGETKVSGTVAAAGTSGKGGEIRVLGGRVEVDATIDASGDGGGGTVLIGGDYQGKNAAVPNAVSTLVGKDAVIRADAVRSGDGGRVVVWADDRTEFWGSISARGGQAGGNGGEAEVSGKKTLYYRGTTDLRAPRGETGTLLLDPTDYTVSPTGDITGSELAGQLGLSKIILQTEGAGGQPGNLTVDDPVDWTGGNSLKLLAHNNIIIKKLIRNTGGGSLTLRSDTDANGSGTVVFGSGGQVVLTGGGTADIFYNPPGGYGSPTGYAGYFTGVTPTAYMLVNDVNQLQAIGSNATSLEGTYALGKDIDASATVGWNGGQGFLPIGDNSLLPGRTFIGTFDGIGHTITGLFINRPTTQYVGLFGGTGLTTIRNVGMVNVSITGGFQTSGFVAHTGGTIEKCYVTGTVLGTSNTVGGLVALNAGTVSNCYSSAKVNGLGTFVGGLVGSNWGLAGNVRNSYSTGLVNDGVPAANIGGLVGINFGTGPNPVVGSYWDTTTSGQAVSAGGTGLPTAHMMQQATFAGWDFVNTWGIVESATYPYHVWPVTGAGGGEIVNPVIPRIYVSGGLDVPGSGRVIQAAVNGRLLSQTTTGADGSFTFRLNESLVPANTALLLYVANSSVRGASVYLSGGGNVANVEIGANALTAISGGGRLSNALLGGAKSGLSSGDIPYGVSGTHLTLAGGFGFRTIGNYYLDGNVTTTNGWQSYGGPVTLAGNVALKNLGTGGNISFGGAVSGTGSLLSLQTAGTVTQAAPIRTGGLELLGAGGAYLLNDGGNAFSTLAGNTGTVNAVSGGDVAVGTVNTTRGLNATGNIVLSSGGSLWLGAPVRTANTATGEVRLTSGGAIVNGLGSSTAVTAPYLYLYAADGIGSGNPLLTATGNLTAVNTRANHIEIGNTGKVILKDIRNLGSGHIRLENTGEAETGALPVTAAGGEVGITAHSPLTIGSGGVSAYRSIALEAADSGGADDLTINGLIASAYGDIFLKAGRSIVFGPGGGLSCPYGRITMVAPNNPVTAGNAAATGSTVVALETVNWIIERVAAIRSLSEDEEEKKGGEEGDRRTDETRRIDREKMYCN